MQVPQPGTDAHRKLLDLVLRRVRSAENALSTKHEQWRRAERTYRLYVDPTEVQGPQQNVTSEAEALYTYPTSIVVPLSYTILQTLISFWTTMYTAQRPYLRIGARDSDSEGPARAQELLLSHQLDYIGWAPFLYSSFLDGGRYGCSVAKIGWDTIRRNQTVRRFMDFPGPAGPIRIQIAEKKPILEFEGNIIEVIDPFQWRPDHRWPLNQFQRGSFCGEALYRSHFELMRQAKEGVYSNVDEIPKRASAEYFRSSTSDRDRIVGANQYFGLSFDNYGSDTLNLVEEVQCDVIPSDYGMGGDEVERWVVTLANRTVIIRVDAFPYDHNDFTYSALETSPDTHAFINPGLLEIMEPVHQHITWFINTMLENARKSLNDRIVFDPAVLNSDDVLSPSAGKTIRVNEEYWGVPGAARNGIFQLNVQDIASQNFKHVGFLIDLLQKISGANDIIQGQPTPEDRSATEISSATQQGASRLRALAQVFSATYFGPLAKQMVQNNMQLMTEPTYIQNIGGMLEEEYRGIGKAVQGGGRMIAPEDIQGIFSFPIADASQPLDPVRFARTWVQVMQVSLQNPALAQRIDAPKVWMEMVRAMGIPDPSRLLLPQNVQVMPDQQLQQQVQQGNLVPMQNPVNRQAAVPNQQPQSIQGQENRPQ